jgi:hypothetical protein
MISIDAHLRDNIHYLVLKLDEVNFVSVLAAESVDAAGFP